jgi:predicted outer membrane repeat protein
MTMNHVWPIVKRISGAAPRLWTLAAIISIPLVTGMLPAHAAVSKCQVKNLNSGEKYSPELQQAIDAAAPDDILQVKGICYGNFTINKSISLQGKSTKLVPQATLTTNGAGRPLTITAGTIVVSDLKITGGNVQGSGGGISNAGQLTIIGNSMVSDNNATDNGGGIFNAGTIILDRSSLTDNETSGDGGGLYNDGGTAGLSGATVQSNVAGGNGGGIFTSGPLNLDGLTVVSGNHADSGGGGLYATNLNLVTIGSDVLLSGNDANYCPDSFEPACDPANKPTVVNATVDAVSLFGIDSSGGVITYTAFSQEDLVPVEFSLEAHPAPGDNTGLAIEMTVPPETGAAEPLSQYTLCTSSGCSRAMKYTPCSYLDFTGVTAEPCSGTKTLQFVAISGTGAETTGQVTLNVSEQDIPYQATLSACPGGVWVYEPKLTANPLIYDIINYQCSTATDPQQVIDDGLVVQGIDSLIDTRGLTTTQIEAMLLSFGLTPNVSTGVQYNSGSGMLYLQATGVTLENRANIIAATTSIKTQ